MEYLLDKPVVIEGFPKWEEFSEEVIKYAKKRYAN